MAFNGIDISTSKLGRIWCMDLTEQWLPIPGYEGAYEVSNRGRVRSLDRVVEFTTRWGKTALSRRKGKVLRPATNGRTGHLHVILPDATRYVHDLVLTAFVGPRPHGLHARHLNGDPDDNRPENLTWGTVSENQRDAVQHGTHTNAAKQFCKWGHEFTPENTKPQRNGKGRSCRACHRRRSLEYLDRKRSERSGV